MAFGASRVRTSRLGSAGRKPDEAFDLASALLGMEFVTSIGPHLHIDPLASTVAQVAPASRIPLAARAPVHGP